MPCIGVAMSACVRRIQLPGAWMDNSWLPVRLTRVFEEAARTFSATHECVTDVDLPLNCLRQFSQPTNVARPRRAVGVCRVAVTRIRADLATRSGLENIPSVKEVGRRCRSLQKHEMSKMK